MKLIADLHTHTTHSHGKDSVDSNVQAAISRGLTAIGIADHSISHVLYGVKRRRFAQYIEMIEAAKKRYADRIEVKTGIELNLIGLDGSVDMPQGVDFDVVIMGYHKAAMCVDCSTAWRFSMGERFGGNGKQRITQAYMKAIQQHDIDIVAHPGYGVPVDYGKLAKACADYGTLFEINEKHADLSAEDIGEAMDAGAAFVISSDAHAAGKIGLAPNAIALAERAGLTASRIVNAEEEA